MQIDLRLPTSWNRCSLNELRAIAEIMTDCAFRASRLRPFDMMEVKVAVFFRLANLEVVEPLNPRKPVEQQYYNVRIRPFSLAEEHSRMRRWYRRSIAWFKRSVLGHDDTFSLYLWQIHSWLAPTPANGKKEGKPGLLDWLDASSPDNLLLFPLRTITRRRSFFCRNVRFLGPAPLMDGFTWQRYRFAQDYMGNYVNAQNRLLQLQRMGRRVSSSDMLKAVKNLDFAKALFLATIYNRRITYVNEETGQTVTDFHYQSNQSSDNAPFFRNFPDRDWQLILLWWQGMMHFLQNTYPKVFKVQKVQNKKPSNPLELYTRTTATMEKYLSMTARDVDREPYTTIIQQLDDITRHNEEMEKINQKMRSKHK